MEYVPGGTLKQLVKKSGPVAEDQAVTWMIQVLEGLSVAHHAGIVHRDLKPDNIMIDATVCQAGRSWLSQTYGFICGHHHAGHDRWYVTLYRP